MAILFYTPKQVLALTEAGAQDDRDAITIEHVKPRDGLVLSADCPKPMLDLFIFDESIYSRRAAIYLNARLNRSSAEPVLDIQKTMEKFACALVMVTLHEKAIAIFNMSAKGKFDMTVRHDENIVANRGVMGRDEVFNTEDDVDQSIHDMLERQKRYPGQATVFHTVYQKETTHV